GGAAGSDRMAADLVRDLGPFTREGQVEPGECPRTLGRGEVRKGPPCDVIEAVPADRPEPQVQRPSIPAGGRWGRVRARRLRTDESEGDAPPLDREGGCRHGEEAGEQQRAAGPGPPTTRRHRRSLIPAGSPIRDRGPVLTPPER